MLNNLYQAAIDNLFVVKFFVERGLREKELTKVQMFAKSNSCENEIRNLLYGVKSLE